MVQEIELKLELTPEAADALLRSDLLPGEPAVAQQRAVYFDTPGQDLRVAGFSLRIRQAGDQRVQTVKAIGSGAAGLFARPERERTVDDDVPILDDTTPVKALLGKIPENLGPAFEVHVERRTWMVTAEDAEIELVLDRGEIRADDRSSPICEVELELKRGSPAALYALARQFAAIVPLWIGVLNKAERGYRLLGPAVRTVKSEPVLLTADMTAEAAFQAIVGACVRHFRLNEALVTRFNAEAMHQARVALRRLRSAFTIHKPMIEYEGFERLREELRWLAAELGAARDLDVLITRDEADAIRTRLEQARDEAYDRAEAALASSRARALMLDLSEWLAIGDWLSTTGRTELAGEPARDFATSVLGRFRRKVKKGGRSLAELHDEARHEVRKDAKKLRYASEFFESLFPEKRQRRRHKRFVDALEVLQDRLGTLNDMVSVAGVLSRIGLDDEPAAAPLLNPAGKRGDLIEAAVEAYDIFADAKPFWR